MAQFTKQLLQVRQRFLLTLCYFMEGYRPEHLTQRDIHHRCNREPTLGTNTHIFLLLVNETSNYLQAFAIQSYFHRDRKQCKLKVTNATKFPVKL
jgi:hypothetical protein